MYTLIAFLSVFVFGVDLKDFLSTIGLIYLSFYNLVKEFKLNIYSVFYNWFNPSSFDNLIKDIRSYVDNSNNRIKAFTTVAIVTTTVPTLWAWDQRVAASLPWQWVEVKVEANTKEFDLKSPELVDEPSVQMKENLPNNLNTSTTPNQFSESFRDKYKLTLVEDYIRINSWDIITSPYFYIPTIFVVTISKGYFIWLLVTYFTDDSEFLYRFFHW